MLYNAIQQMLLFLRFTFLGRPFYFGSLETQLHYSSVSGNEYITFDFESDHNCKMFSALKHMRMSNLKGIYCGENIKEI